MAFKATTDGGPGWGSAFSAAAWAEPLIASSLVSIGDKALWGWYLLEGKGDQASRPSPPLIFDSNFS